MATAEDGQTECVRIVYVVSRTIEFIELGGGEAIVHRLKRLQELIQRDRMQSEESYARATSTKLLSAVQKPAENRWQSATGRRAMPAERPRVPCVPVANQFAALSDDQEQSDQGSNAGSMAGSGGSSTASKVLGWLRDLAEDKRRRERRRPNQRSETQDQNDQRRQTVEVGEQEAAAPDRRQRQCAEAAEVPRPGGAQNLAEVTQLGRCATETQQRQSNPAMLEEERHRGLQKPDTGGMDRAKVWPGPHEQGVQGDVAGLPPASNLDQHREQDDRQRELEELQRLAREQEDWPREF